jgi:CheY-like chemotaxis protein
MRDSQAGVLLIEDSEDDVILMRRAFKRAGISIPHHWIPDGRAAIDYLAHIAAQPQPQQCMPDLVLLDIKLPYRTGLEVLEWIRSQPIFNSLAVVMFTSSNDISDRREAQRLGATSYLVKPSSVEGLVTVVRQIHAQWLARVPAENHP